MYIKDTIVAIATPQGNGGIGIIRISGINALPIAEKLTKNDSNRDMPHFVIFITLMRL